MPDNSAEIAKLQAILNEGARSVSIDGQSVTYDFAAIRKRIRTLMLADPNYRGKRPRLSRINLGGF